MTTTAIAFQGVHHEFRPADGSTVRALHHVDLAIPPGEFATVVGPSGCGKSTLLRMVAGLIRPTAGALSLFGEPVTGPRKDIGIVFQSPTLLPWLDVVSNLTFPIRHRGETVTAEDRDRATALLDLVGLAAFRHRFPDELSGGMQQRVGIARALLTNPSVLLMDEPFSALDALTRDEMSFELLRLWTARQSTALFITHSVAEAVLLSDRIFVMSPRPGRIRDVMTVDLPRPRSVETMRQPLFHDLSDRLRSQLLSRHELH